MFASTSARTTIFEPRARTKTLKNRRMSTRITSFMTLRSEPDAPARSVTSDDVSSWPEIERQLIKACSIHAGDSSVNGRMQAAGQLGPHTTHDAVSEMSVVEVFTTAYEGSLDDCSTILDVHYRLLAETLIQGNTELVEHVYEKFAALPPRLRKSSLRATAACAEAGLLHTREEYEMMNAVLSEVVERAEKRTKALCRSLKRTTRC